MLRLRDYTPQDFDAIWSLDQRCFPAGIAYSQAEIQRYLRMRGTFAIIAEDEGRLAGLVIAHAGRAQGYVITIDIDAAFRRSGVGSQLMAAAESRIRAARAKLIHLEVAVDNDSAIAFYRRHGYQIVRTIRDYYQGKTDAFKMVKRLDV